MLNPSMKSQLNIYLTILLPGVKPSEGEKAVFSL